MKDEVIEVIRTLSKGSRTLSITDGQLLEMEDFFGNLKRAQFDKSRSKAVTLQRIQDYYNSQAGNPKVYMHQTYLIIFWHIENILSNHEIQSRNIFLLLNKIVWLYIISGKSVQRFRCPNHIYHANRNRPGWSPEVHQSNRGSESSRPCQHPFSSAGRGLAQPNNGFHKWPIHFPKFKWLSSGAQIVRV